MRHVKSIPTLALILFMLPVTYAQTVVGDGDVVTEQRPLEPFSSVETSHGWDLILEQGQGHQMTIEAERNIIDLLKTEVDNGVLKIYFEKGVQIRRSKRKHIYLTFESLESITASGGSDVKAEDALEMADLNLRLSGGSDLSLSSLRVEELKMHLSGGSDADIDFRSIERLEVNASGGSDLSLNNFKGDFCKLELSGGSDATLRGGVTEAIIVASGGSDISGKSFQIGSGDLRLMGGSDATLHLNGKVDLELGGGSDLHALGNPDINSKSVCKSCDLKIGD